MSAPRQHTNASAPRGHANAERDAERQFLNFIAIDHPGSKGDGVSSDMHAQGLGVSFDTDANIAPGESVGAPCGTTSGLPPLMVDEAVPLGCELASGGFCDKSPPFVVPRKGSRCTAGLS